MSFAKADQLLELVTMMAARRAGITLADVEDRFAISHRTAQRMMRNVEARHPEIEIREDDDGTRRWLMRGGQLRDFLTLTAGELAALDLAMGHLAHAGQTIEAKSVRGLKEKIIALVPCTKAARLDTDHDALLEAQVFVARPGPRPHIDEALAETVAEALKACRIVEVAYQGAKDAEPRRRTLAPYGLLSGLRRYLVARPEDDPNGPVRTYRMDAIHRIRIHTGSRNLLRLFASEGPVCSNLLRSCFLNDDRSRLRRPGSRSTASCELPDDRCSR
jgi:predicted DNA-binding transcriptional regulator YafY